MSEIKFDFISKHDDDITFMHEVYTLDEIMYTLPEYVYDGHPKKSFTIIAKRQYTGLHDKNGVEIYEGDILIADKKDSKNKDWIGVVEHNNYGGLCLYYYEYRNTLDRQFASCIQDPQTAAWVMQSCEVIGNIYENKELLNERR